VGLRHVAGASAASVYKVYSSDNVAPTLYFPNPGDGQALHGSSYNFVVYSNDDHAVGKIELYIDNALQTATSQQIRNKSTRVASMSFDLT
jgi:hypothetical protein